ncbi:MAG: protein BatD [Proteobacteria bacterium]|nr:protein BatD [Pseudomonadota bacterium]
MTGRFLLLLLLVSSSAWAAPGGRTGISIDTQKTLWVGQRVLVHLDIKTDGFSFSGQRFDLPQISGGVLIQTDSSTLKLTEQIEGERWQVLRYDLSLFAQREGDMEIPPFDVHFSASAGYGQPVASFDLKTEALRIRLSLPPGADPSRPVVTSSDLTVEEQWQPDQAEFKVGEALTRTIIVRAEDVSGIALPAAPNQAVDGIDQLPKAPLVEDKTDRGTLSGSRQEQVSYLFKREGRYTLPGGELSWWNPKSEKLEQYQFEPRQIEVFPDPLAKAAGETPQEGRQKSRFTIGLIAFFLLTLIALLWWLWPRVKAYRVARFNSEPAQFKRAIKACRQNEVSLAWSTTNTWLVTSGLSMPLEDEVIWQELQQALVSESAGWSGRALKQSLIRLRKNQRSQANKVVFLKPLNP